MALPWERPSLRLFGLIFIGILIPQGWGCRSEHGSACQNDSRLNRLFTPDTLHGARVDFFRVALRANQAWGQFHRGQRRSYAREAVTNLAYQFPY